jgi:predicted aspartyl protease
VGLFNRMRPVLMLVVLLSLVTPPKPAKSQPELGKALINRVRQCISQKIPNPQQAAQEKFQNATQECVFNTVMMGPNGRIREDASERMAFTLNTLGIRLPKRTAGGQAEVALKPTDGGIYMLPVTIAGNTRNFLFDTGATNSILESQLTKQLKLPSISISKNLFQQGVVGNQCTSSDISITVHPFPLVSVGQARVQRINGLGFPKSFIPGGLAGVLGIDFLSSYDLVVDPKASKLQLLPPTPMPSEAIPLVGKSGIVTAQVYINGQGPFTFGLDTGAGITVMSERVAQQLALTKGEKEQLQGFCGIDEGHKTKLAEFVIGNQQVKNMNAVIFRNNLFDLIGMDGLIGQNFLKQYQQHWRFDGTNEMGLVQSGSIELN